MKLQDLINVTDPNMDGLAWLNFCDNKGVLMFKANSCSSFLIPFYDRKIEYLAAVDRNLFKVCLEDEI